MRGVGTDIGTIHFVGIGGIGMSGIAEVMHNLGYTVQGSDLAEGLSVERLRARGIAVTIGHARENVDGAAVVVTSTAVRRSNPEVAAALEGRIPVVRRAEMLAELMRLKSTVAVAGTHGKTTTTSMIAALLDAGNIDPTVINGGIINQYGSNARLGDSDWIVVEADESDGSFLRLDGTIAVVTNIDPEHLDHYGSFDAVKQAFVDFIENVPFYGVAVLCVDHPEVQTVISKVRDRRILTYGFSAQADLRGENIRSQDGGNIFDVVHRARDGAITQIADVHLPMPGRHNVQNALAAIAVAMEMGCDAQTICGGFAQFGGVKRRFTNVGTVNVGGMSATIIDDYAHHPVEIVAVLSAAREAAQNRVIAVVQPHRYTRLRDLMDEFQTSFNDADMVYVTPVFEAGEEKIDGVDAAALVQGLKQRGHRNAAVVENFDTLASTLASELQGGDMVVCLGAGDITKWAAGLADAVAGSVSGTGGVGSDGAGFDGAESGDVESGDIGFEDDALELTELEETGSGVDGLEQVETEISGQEQVGLEQIESEEVESEEMGPEEIGATNIEAGFTGSEVGGSEVGGSEVGGSEVGGSEVGGSEVGGGEVGGAEISALEDSDSGHSDYEEGGAGYGGDGAELSRSGEDEHLETGLGAETEIEEGAEMGTGLGAASEAESEADSEAGTGLGSFVELSEDCDDESHLESPTDSPTEAHAGISPENSSEDHSENNGEMSAEELGEDHVEGRGETSDKDLPRTSGHTSGQNSFEADDENAVKNSGSDSGKFG